MNTVEVLKAARALIADEAHWAQGFYAVNADGNVTDPFCEDACKFCSVGAVANVLGIYGSEAEDHDIIRQLNHAAGYFSDSADIVGFNDNYTHDEVLTVFDRAIEHAGGAA